MNIFKTYPHNDISDATLHKRHAELLATGICNRYFKDDYLWMQFNHQYYHGVNSVKDLLQLIYNNKEFAKDIYDITDDEIVSDNDEFSLTIKKEGEEATIVIDFKKKTITGFKNKNWTYNDEFILSEKKNNTPPTSSNETKVKENPTDVIVTNKKENSQQSRIVKTTVIDNDKSVIKKYLDYTDLDTKKFIDSFGRKDIKFLANKLNKIYRVMPGEYYNIFEGGKIDSSKPANINEFTIKGVKWYMHCTFNKETNNYDCDIIKEDK